MSPAKRLSRQRFRALCERCAKWTYGGEVEPRGTVACCAGYVTTLEGAR